MKCLILFLTVAVIGDVHSQMTSSEECFDCADGAISEAAQTSGIIFQDLDGSVLAVNISVDAYSVDYHFRKNLIFVSNYKTNTISVQQLNTSVRGSSFIDKNISILGDWQPVALAVDWVGNKLYVADKAGLKIDFFELDGRWHSVVVSNLSNPMDLALDPYKRLIFVADGSQVTRIDMDGTHNKTNIATNTGLASGIAVDYIKRKVFYCEYTRDTIVAVDYEGNDSNDLGGLIKHPYKLAFSNGLLYCINRAEIYSIDPYKQNFTLLSLFEPKTFMRDILIVNSLNQMNVKTNCDVDNGGCAQLCLVTALTDGNLGHCCDCALGYRLSKNLRDCELITEFILYSESRAVRAMVLDHHNDSSNGNIFSLLSKESLIVALEFDWQDKYVYYVDYLQQSINRFYINGSKTELVIKTKDESVEGMAMDWISKYLYYVNTNGSLNVLSTKNVTLKKTLLKDLKKPRGIAVHPNKGYVFFSLWSIPAYIMRVNTDGSNLLVIQNVTNGFPNSLSIDYSTDRVYWGDAKADLIKHTKLDGTDEKTIFNDMIKHPYSMVVHKQSIYFSDWIEKSIIELDKLTGQFKGRISKRLTSGNVFGVRVYSEQYRQIDLTHPCVNNNGKCEKFCFAVQTFNGKPLHPICGCLDDEILDVGGSSCISS